jgi:hypothetical protein
MQLISWPGIIAGRTSDPGREEGTGGGILQEIRIAEIVFQNRNPAAITRGVMIMQHCSQVDRKVSVTD